MKTILEKYLTMHDQVFMALGMLAFTETQKDTTAEYRNSVLVMVKSTVNTYLHTVEYVRKTCGELPFYAEGMHNSLKLIAKALSVEIGDSPSN